MWTSRKNSKTISSFIKEPTRVFALALSILFVFTVTFSVLGYLNYFSNLSFSEIIGPVISAAAILFSALWASTFVVQNMNDSRETAKLHETLTLIRAAELDAEFIAAKRVWAKYRARENYNDDFAMLMAAFLLDAKKIRDLNSDDILPWLVKPGGVDELIRHDALLLITYFNFYEISSLSIKKEIMHEGFFKEWYATSFIRVWNISVHAISAIRKLHSNDRLYRQWQLKVEQWGRELEIKVKEPPEYNIRDLVNLAKRANLQGTD